MRAGSGASNSGSIHTFPVNHSAGPSCPAGLSRDRAGTAEAVAEEDADARVFTRFISMPFSIDSVKQRGNDGLSTRETVLKFNSCFPAFLRHTFPRTRAPHSVTSYFLLLPFSFLYRLSSAGS